MKVWRGFKIFGACALGTLLACSTVYSLAASDQGNVDATVAGIVKARDYTAQFVVLAKKSFAEGTPQYNQAFKLYAAAYSDYGAWDAYLASALASGRIKNKRPITNDEEYDKLATAAEASGTTFVSYVDANTRGQAMAVVTILSSLADLGIKLWTQISTENRQNRTAASSQFAQATVWQSWAQITDGSSPVPSLPKSNSDDTKGDAKGDAKTKPPKAGS